MIINDWYKHINIVPHYFYRYSNMKILLHYFLCIFVSASIIGIPAECSTNSILIENLPVQIFDKFDNNVMMKLNVKEKPETVNIQDGRTIFKWSTIEITLRSYRLKDTKCAEIIATVVDSLKSPGVCVNLADLGYVYGGGEVYYQYWPMNEQTLAMQPFVTNDVLYQNVSERRTHGLWGSIQERYWISTSGIGIYVPDDTPLWVSQSHTSQQLCFMGHYGDSVYRSSKHYQKIDQTPYLNMSFCFAKDINVLHKTMFPSFYSHPKQAPDDRMLKSPIWSTWARFKYDVDQQKVIKFAQDIASHRYPYSHIEIDDKFSTAYGDFNFDPIKFPEAQKMVNQLHNLGFRVTCWIMPFATNDSQAYLEGNQADYFNKKLNSNETEMVTWWLGFYQSKAATIDVTNPKAVKWFLDRLRMFKSTYKLDSYKFDAGEVHYIPKLYSAFKQPESPVHYSRDYVNNIVNGFGNSMVETRVGFKSQSAPVYVRLFDKDSTWGYDNGIKTIIPGTLLSGLLGYPFVLPDMIGGNAYCDDSFVGGKLPDKELYIRWMQLNAFLPAIQFSIAPWDYDNETVRIGLEMMQLHKKIFYPEAKLSLKELFKDGTPIIRPLWLKANLSIEDKEQIYTRDDQFFVGDRLLVAPVLNEGQRSRDIYLPSGVWFTPEDNKFYLGPKLLRNYSVPLEKIAYFFNSGKMLYTNENDIEIECDSVSQFMGTCLSINKYWLKLH